jgi:hypothetical protein
MDADLLLEGVEGGDEIDADPDELRVQCLEVGQPGVQPGDFLDSGAVERSDEGVEHDRPLAQQVGELDLLPARGVQHEVGGLVADVQRGGGPSEGHRGEDDHGHDSGESASKHHDLLHPRK